MFPLRQPIKMPRINPTFALFAIYLAWLAAWQPVARADDIESLRRPIRAFPDLVFSEVEGEKLRADIYRPDNDQLAPGVLMIHGGAWSAGDKWNMRDHARQLAQAGYVAISINYRLAPQFQYPAQIDDCRAALRWIHQEAGQYQMDPQRVAVYGYSAGGHLAALLATDPIEGLPRVKVAILGGAPCDFEFLSDSSQALAHVMGGSRKQRPQVYKEAAPLTYCSQDDCPTFFFHGNTDMIVPTEASRVMYRRLKELGVETQFYSVEKYGHLVTFLHPDARAAAIEFLDKHLKQDR